MRGRIKANHGTEIPSSHIFLDTETISDKKHEFQEIQNLTFRLVCANYVRFENGKVKTEIRKHFKEISELWKFVESYQNQKRPLHVWAHNLGFDLTILKFWDRLESGEYEVGIVDNNGFDPRFQGSKGFRGCMVLEGRPCFIKSMGRYGKVQFDDLGNYINAPLADIGESIGFPKLKWPGNETDDETLIEYCQRDVDILQNSVLSLLNYWQQNDLGVWQATGGSLALTSWRHIELRHIEGEPDIIVLPKREVEPDQFEKEGYLGGRLECYYIGKRKEQIYHLDVQSHYPSVMLTNRFPSYRVAYYRKPDREKAMYYMRNERCMARVFLSTQKEEFPVKMHGRLIFAKGEFWTTLCGPELQRAVDGGVIQQVREMAVYDLDFLFTRWVTRLWRMKHEAKITGQLDKLLFINMLLRALSGKFAQGGLRWQDCPLLASPFDWGQWTVLDSSTNEVRLFRSVAGNVQEKVYSDPPEWGFPAISAWITSHGREKLRYLISLCPERSVLHVATDSLHVTEDGYQALEKAGQIREDSLGFLSIRDVSFDSEFCGPNDYRTDQRICKQGNWGKAKEDEKGVYWFSQWERLPTILKHRPDGTVKIQEIKIENDDLFNKLVYDQNGQGRPIILHREESEFRPLIHLPERWIEN